MYKLKISELGRHLLALSKTDLHVSDIHEQVDEILVLIATKQKYVERQESIASLLALIVLFDQVRLRSIT